MQGVQCVTRIFKRASSLRCFPDIKPSQRLLQVHTHSRPLAAHNHGIGGRNLRSVLSLAGRTTTQSISDPGSLCVSRKAATYQNTGAQFLAIGAKSRVQAFRSKPSIASRQCAAHSGSMALKAAEEHLADLGYYFTHDALQMRQVANDEGFEFRTQAHYEELGDSVAAYIQELMMAEYGMQRVLLPLSQDQGVRVVEEDDKETEGGVPIFVSKNAQEAKAVLVLVCGSGAVMAGQWARKLCMNDSLHEGSVLPLLVWASQRRIATVVLNPNFRPDEGRRISAEAHVVQAWDQVVASLPARHVAMVAHSYGGVCACRLLSVREREVLGRLRCIAFTDSVHGTWGPDILSSAAKRFFVRDCVNWVQSETPLDTLVEAEFLPKEDRETEPKRKPGRKSERKTQTETEMETKPERETGSGGAAEAARTKGLKTETEMETETEAGTHPMAESKAAGVSVYDEELADISPKNGEKGKAEQAGEKHLGRSEIGAAAEGLGFTEEGAADVSMAEGGSAAAGGAADVGQVLNLLDKAGMAAAIEKEQDPGLKAMLRKLAGESAPEDDRGAAAGDVSGAGASDVSSAAAGSSAVEDRDGGRGHGRGDVSEALNKGLGRKAKKSGFSWAKLGRNKEYCRCREVSAGVDEHERTTYSALESVKKFLEAKLAAAGAELR